MFGYKCVLWVLFLACVPAFAAKQKKAVLPPAPVQPEIMPVTSNSAEARAIFEKAMVSNETLRLEQAAAELREAVKKDPDFALAHLLLSYRTTDPAEEKQELERAKALAKAVTPGERLMIAWISNVREGDYIQGIAAMNDMLSMFPKDKRTIYIAADWLSAQQQYEPARRHLEHVLTIDPNYYPAFNDLGYAYAFDRHFDQAFAAMEKYVKLLPNEPNPQDSFGELMRMAGRFDGALEHYNAALKIDPKFWFSQLGLGDTYALMGNLARAREEYGKAIQTSETDARRVTVLVQQALTYVRENKLEEADKAFAAVAEDAHKAGLGLQEAQVHRMVATYRADSPESLKHLDEADRVLTGHKHEVSKSDLEQESARILRVRAIAAREQGQKEASGKALQELQQMANNSHDTVVQRSFHAAAGALLEADGKHAEAIPHLEEDARDAFSMRRLIEAYQKSGQQESAEALKITLAALDEPTLEQALVVQKIRRGE